MERSDVWLLSGYTFRGVAVLFRSATLPQSTPILLHISAIVCRVMNTSVNEKLLVYKLLIMWVGGSKKGEKIAYVIKERSLSLRAAKFRRLAVFG